jgi:septal ring-binding cell division protein DamX
MRRGAVNEAARGFADALKQAPRGTHTVQLLVACSDETVAKATQATPGDDLFVVPVTLKGRACYRMCWGLYDSAAKAQSALGTVPAYFREGGATPKAMSTAEILP